MDHSFAEIILPPVDAFGATGRFGATFISLYGRCSKDGPGSSLVAGWHQEVQGCFEAAGFSQAI